jgi:Holliday junction resolvase RusA-like endonuclease
VTALTQEVQIAVTVTPRRKKQKVNGMRTTQRDIFNFNVVVKKVKQSRYRPGVAQMVPGS